MYLCFALNYSFYSGPKGSASRRPSHELKSTLEDGCSLLYNNYLGGASHHRFCVALFASSLD